MIKTTLRIKQAYNILNLKWWPTLLATILGFLDSVANIVLLLSIGEFVARQIHTTSTKGNILKIFFGEQISDYTFNLIFVFVLFTKAFTISTKYFLNEKIKIQIEKELTLELFRKGNHKSLRKLKSALTKFIIKGIIGFLSDVFFMLLVFCILLSYHSSLAFAYFIFVILIISIARFFLQFNKTKISEASTKRNRYLKKEKLIERDFLELKHNNRIEKEIGILAKRFQAYEIFARRKNILLSLAEAISPVAFFSFLILISLTYSHLNLISTSSFLEIILLLIYSQGPIRRSLRIPRYWIAGGNALEKIQMNRNSFNNEEQLKQIVERVRYGLSQITAVITSLPFENLNSILSSFKKEQNTYPFHFRYFNIQSKLVGETVISALSYKSTTKERPAIVDLVQALNLPKEFSDELDSPITLNPNFSKKFLFYGFVIMSELDNSEIIFFSEEFRNEFLKLKDTSSIALKKTYICL